jgi:hypothetical protein
MTIAKVSLGFIRLPDSEFSDFTVSVVTKMKNNPHFTTPVVDLSLVTSTNTTFVAQIAAAAQGGTLLTAQKNATRAVMEGQLRALAAYVQSIAGDDLAMMLSAGFWNTSTDRTRKPLAKPTVLDIDNFASTQLMLRLTPVDNARSYEVRIRTGSQDWRMAGIYTKSRGVLLEGLVPGATYEIQVRAVGGSTGYSDWSDPVSHMAI